jgi:plastocyanin
MRYAMALVTLLWIAGPAFAAGPSNLVATGRSDTQISLLWAANGNTFFTVDYLGPQYFGGSMATCSDFPPHNNIFETSSDPVTISGLLASTWYHIHVHAIGPGEDGGTNIIIVRTRASGAGFESLTANSPEYINCGTVARDRSIDFDGDLKADHTVFHPSTGLWYIRGSIAGAVTTVGYGGAAYTPVPGDYDGDNKTDIAVYHPSSGLWFIRASSTGVDSTTTFGGVDYKPVRGDFDGDGRTDLALFHDPTGLWFLRSGTGTVTTVAFGGAGYTPAPGDYDGDGKTDIAIYHEPSGLWVIRSSALGTDSTTGFGGPGYIPVRGNFDGDLKTDLAVFHDATGLWFVKSSITGTVQTVGYGATGYTPVPEDYDGDGKTDFAVYHAPTGLWFTRSSLTSTTTTTGFGGSGFNPVNSTTTPLPDLLIEIQGIAGGMSYSPSAADVRVGQRVVWKNVDGTFSHTATADGGAFNTGPLSPGTSSAPITMGSAGSLPYHCTIHPSMTGLLSVWP